MHQQPYESGESFPSWTVHHRNFKEKEAEKLTKEHNNPWPKLIGRANEDQIMINGHPVTALLDTGSQVTHVSEAFCHANNFQIYPLDKLVEIEGTGGTLLNT